MLSVPPTRAPPQDQPFVPRQRPQSAPSVGRRPQARIQEVLQSRAGDQEQQQQLQQETQLPPQPQQPPSSPYQHTSAHHAEYCPIDTYDPRVLKVRAGAPARPQTAHPLGRAHSASSGSLAGRPAPAPIQLSEQGSPSERVAALSVEGNPPPASYSRPSSGAGPFRDQTAEQLRRLAAETQQKQHPAVRFAASREDFMDQITSQMRRGQFAPKRGLKEIHYDKMRQSALERAAYCRERESETLERTLTEEAQRTQDEPPVVQGRSTGSSGASPAASPAAQRRRCASAPRLGRRFQEEADASAAAPPAQGGLAAAGGLRRRPSTAGLNGRDRQDHFSTKLLDQSGQLPRRPFTAAAGYTGFVPRKYSAGVIGHNWQVTNSQSRQLLQSEWRAAGRASS